jgi:chromosome segregation ATPase
MKSTLKNFGVIGPRHYRHLREQIEKAQARNARLAEELAEAKAAVRELKAQSENTAKALHRREEDAQHHQHRADKISAELDRVKTESRQKLEAVKRDLTLAREALMAVDVKLDILEGAANVLDLRTRGGV